MTPEPTKDVEDFKEFERERFSNVAQGYDKETAPVTSQISQAVLDAVSVGPGDSLLDIACGPGWLSSAAAQRGAAVSAVDFAENMVLLARSRCPEADVRKADAESLPFEEGQFDAAVCSFGILHFPNPEKAIAEAHRVLRSGGRYAFTCWTPPPRNALFGLVLGSIERYGNVNMNLPAGPPYFRFGDPEECERVLAAAGFVSVSVTEWPIVWFYTRPEDIVPAVVASSARIGPTLAMQTPEQRRSIETAIVEGAKIHATPRGIEIPTPAILATGRKL